MYKKLSCCQYCNLSFDNLTTPERANHSRWCQHNPKRSYYCEKNSAKQMQTVEAIKKRTQGIKQAHAIGRYVNAAKKGVDTKKKNGTLTHTAESIELIRQKALASSHRRLKRKMIEYNGIWLDSTWELELAKRLDELKIKWYRPAPIKWVDHNNTTHNYFPDFYLPDYDLFLDPKNPQAYRVQENKIKILLEQYKNLVIIRTLKDCKDFQL
jgi:hypothetical protein